MISCALKKIQMTPLMWLAEGKEGENREKFSLLLDLKHDIHALHPETKVKCFLFFWGGTLYMS